VTAGWRWLGGLAAIACPAFAADDAALGKQLFTETAVPACALCHTLGAAGATGAVGPSLDELKPDASRVANALRDGVGSMPSYKALLSEAQILLLARYVARASGGEK
jgi:cytochrome c6